MNVHDKFRSPCPSCGKKYSDLRQHIRVVHEGAKVMISYVHIIVLGSKPQKCSVESDFCHILASEHIQISIQVPTIIQFHKILFQRIILIFYRFFVVLFLVLVCSVSVFCFKVFSFEVFSFEVFCFRLFSFEVFCFAVFRFEIFCLKGIISGRMPPLQGPVHKPLATYKQGYMLLNHYRIWQVQPGDC